MYTFTYLDVSRHTYILKLLNINSTPTIHKGNVLKVSQQLYVFVIELLFCNTHLLTLFRDCFLNFEIVINRKLFLASNIQNYNLSNCDRNKKHLKEFLSQN